MITLQHSLHRSSVVHSLGAFTLCILALTFFNSALAMESPAFWLEKGQDLFLNGSYQEAIDSYDRVIKIDSENVLAWKGKGEALSRLGRYKMAELCFDFALNRDPDNAGLWLEKAKAGELVGDLSRALAGYDRALDLDDRLAEAWLGKGNVSIALGSFSEALKSYKNASSLGRNTSVEEVMALLAQGKDFSRRGKFEEALDSFNAALVQNQSNIEAMLEKGEALSDLGRFDVALQIYDAVLLVSPNDQRAKAGKARALVDLGLGNLANENISEANTNYDEAFGVDPLNNETTASRVKDLRNEGDIQKRNSLFPEALKSNEANPAISPEDAETIAGIEMVLADSQVTREETVVSTIVSDKNVEETGYQRFFSQGLELTRNGSYSAALESFNESIEDRWQQRRRVVWQRAGPLYAGQTTGSGNCSGQSY